MNVKRFPWNLPSKGYLVGFCCDGSEQKTKRKAGKKHNKLFPGVREREEARAKEKRESPKREKEGKGIESRRNGL